MELWQLQQLQGLPLEVKIQKTKLRIKEWYEHYEGKVYVSFSGGKDSTVLLHLVRCLYPDVIAVFSDTGLEFPEIKQFVNTTDNVLTIKPKKTFKQVVDEYGYPVIGKEAADCIEGGRKGQKYRLDRLDGTLKNKDGNKSRYDMQKYAYLMDAPFKISGKCCNELKKKPFKLLEKERNIKPMIGTMTEESQLRTQVWLKSGCNGFLSTRPISTPISFWRESDIWEYINKYRVSYSKIYDMGYTRTGCMFCMFGVHLEKGDNRFQMMAKTHPKIHDYCINKLGCGEVLDYIGVDYKANPQMTIDDFNEQ